MAWQIAKMIVNDVVSQSNHCSPARSTKVHTLTAALFHVLSACSCFNSAHILHISLQCTWNSIHMYYIWYLKIKVFGYLSFSSWMSGHSNKVSWDFLYIITVFMSSIPIYTLAFLSTSSVGCASPLQSSVFVSLQLWPSREPKDKPHIGFISQSTELPWEQTRWFYHLQCVCMCVHVRERKRGMSDTPVGKDDSDLP